jgi:hypothetical protein
MRRNSLIAGRIRWAALSAALISVASLFVATAAQAVVVNDNGTVAGVALVPSARQFGSTTTSYLNAAGIPIVTSSGSCADPAASTEPDILSAGSWPLSAPAQPICWHGGQVMHSNEAFTLEWEGQAPNTYWSGTKGYVQSFLGDVAAASGQLVNPYSDTTQYWDNNPVNPKVPSSARAAYSSVFGGGCNDNGTAKCRFGSITGSGAGNPLPSSSTCPVAGNNVYGGSAGGGAPLSIPNNLCVTDAEIQHEVTSLIDNDGLIAHTQSGRTPLVTVMTPPGVVVCLDSAGALCSANAGLTPPVPAVSVAGTGGNIPAGTYQVVTTYITTSGENLPSAPSTVTTTGSTSTLTVSSPTPQSNVTGWYVYVAPAGGGAYVRQGSANTIGAPASLTALSNSGPNPPTQPARFCSYHKQVVDPQSGQPVSYVVQPWTAFTICDEPDVPALADNPTPAQIEKSAGQRLVSPLSQGSVAAITNPYLNAWFGLDGLEINDQNSCQPLGHSLDTFSFGTSGQSPYFLQRESNNTSVVDSDPFTYFGCLPNDVLEPTFVAPTAINLGDTIDLDGSATASSLAIPNANYSWDFGDGTGGNGPSVEHTYAAAGSHTVTLTVSDRGGNQASFSQLVAVLGANGLPTPPSNPPTTNPTNVGSSGPLQVRIQLLPQALRSVLRSGISVQVSSNGPANGIAMVYISRATAKRAHIKVGRGTIVVIGRGTLSQVKDGTGVLHLYLSGATASKLKHLKHATLNVRLSLVGVAGAHLVVVAAGRY